MKFYYDLDDTLADFNAQPNAMERFRHEKGFFYNLKPTALVQRITKLPTEIHILSTSPNEQADNDKKAWVKKHLPQVKDENIILVRDNSEKARYAHGNVLVDDHTPNLLDWISNGGYAIKVANYHNCKQGRSRKLQTIKIS